MKRSRKALIAGLVLAMALLAVAAIAPSLATSHIVPEPLSPRSEITDDVTALLKIKHHGEGATVIHMKDLSNTVVVKFTVQPRAVFPWHTHPGPVLVNIAQGELVYVPAETCDEHTYTAGQAFFDPGHGHVHSAYNPSETDVTVFYATFFQAPPAPAPLSILDVTPGECDLPD